jgi:hypothetical protein
MYQCHQRGKIGAMRPPSAKLLITQGRRRLIKLEDGARRDSLSPRYGERCVTCASSRIGQLSFDQVRIFIATLITLACRPFRIFLDYI